MPFTFAHPAAAIPLLRPLGRAGVLSALVIGSMMPDLAYLFPGSGLSVGSHSIMGLLWFCLPAGLLCYLVFHVVLKRPLLELAPPAVYARLGRLTRTCGGLPGVPWLAVALSLLLGAATHLLWDAFTHAGAPAVRLMPVLQLHLFSVGAYQVHLFKLLQHLSTVTGLLLLIVWSRHWLKKAGADVEPLPVILPTFGRYGVIAAIVLSSLAAAGMAAHAARDAAALNVLAGKAVFAALPVFLFAILAYSVAWHVWRLSCQARIDRVSP